MSFGRIVISFFTLVAAGVAQCPGNGALTLAINGNRLGDPLSIQLSGTPSAPGLIAVDTAGGPVTTPIGPLCLGLTPMLQLLPFSLDAAGTLSATGLLPLDPTLTGFTAYLQAAAVDPLQPNNLAVSAGVAHTLRPPRICFYDPGHPTAPITTGSFCVLDALTDAPTTGAIALSAAPVRDAVAVPDLGWFVFLLGNLVGNQVIVAFDAATGAQVLTLPVPASPGLPWRLAVDGTTLLVLCRGASPTQGRVLSYALPTGAAGPVVPLPLVLHEALLVIPGAGLMYVRAGSAVIPIVGGVSLPPILIGGGTVGAITDWKLFGTSIYCMSAGTTLGGAPITPPWLLAINTLTQATTALPVIQPFVAPLQMLRIGPGSAAPAPSLFAYSAASGAILEFSPNTLLPVGSIPAGPGIIAMELSAGGAEWLLLCNGSGCGGVPALEVMYPPSLVPTIMMQLPPDTQPQIVTVPSTTMRKAYLVGSTNLVAPLPTDPLGFPYLVASLPVSAGQLRVVVD